jgi:hypothetical protein
MKNTYTKLMIIASSLFVISCSKVDDYTNKSNLVVSGDVTPTMSAVIVPPATVANLSLTTINVSNESLEKEYTFRITLSKTQAVETRLAISQSSGTATLDADYKVYGSDGKDVTSIIFPANTLTKDITVKILKDGIVEGDEDFTLQIGDITNANINFPPKSLMFKIQNYLFPNLDLLFNYDKAFTITSGAAYTLYAVAYDLDFYILDSTLADTGIYNAAATSAAEKVSINSSVATTLGNGTYHIVYDLYGTSNLNNVPHTEFPIPVTTEYFRGGGISRATVLQESAFAVTSKKAAGYQSPGAIPNYVISFKIQNGVYTILNSLNQTIASGRLASTNAAIQAAIVHARQNNRKLNPNNVF